MSNPQYTVCDKAGMHYYAFRGIDDDLICLVRTEYNVPWGHVLRAAYAALDEDALPGLTPQIHSTKVDWSSAEWNTWLAFDLCPVIEIINKEPGKGGPANEIKFSWDWYRIKP